MSTPAQTPCALCALAVGNHPFTHHFAEAEKQFCCLGCLNVYTILHESGALAGAQDIRETDLFKRSLALGLISNGDQAAAQQIPPDAPRQEMLLQVSGMWCSSCAWLIEHALHQERGVVSAEAFFASDLVKINYCPQYAPPERLTRRLAELGYRASEYTGEQETAQAERRDLLLRLGVAGFFWLNLMTLSTPLYVSLFEPIGASFQRGLPLVLMALATPVIFYSAQPIMRLAWGALREGTVRMETLLGLGILAAFVYSAFEALRGATHVYFDTASAIVTLVLLGKLIERSAKERTGRALTLLYRLMPKKVRRLTADGAERFVALEALTLDDVFMVKAGERIPADGVIVTGATHVDESLLTGEAAPIAKATGDTVVAGSLNTGGVIEVRATRIGGDTTLAQELAAHVAVVDAGGVATSSTLSRRWRAEHADHHHLIDPATGRSADTEVASITVVADAGWRAEVLATGAAIGGVDEAIGYLEGQGVDGVVVDRFGAVRATMALPEAAAAR